MSNRAKDWFAAEPLAYTVEEWQAARAGAGRFIRTLEANAVRVLP